MKRVAIISFLLLAALLFYYDYDYRSRGLYLSQEEAEALVRVRITNQFKRLKSDSYALETRLDESDVECTKDRCVKGLPLSASELGGIDIDSSSFQISLDDGFPQKDRSQLVWSFEWTCCGSKDLASGKASIFKAAGEVFLRGDTVEGYRIYFTH